MVFATSFFTDPVARMPTVRSSPTPNPNSLKFTADGHVFLDEGMVAVSSVDDADDGSLAHRLLSVAGVADVFMTPQFVTISKDSAADWATLAPKVTSILEDALEAS